MPTCKCKSCGGSITYEQNQTIAECEYCGVEQTIVCTNDSKKLSMFDRANSFRLKNDFDNTYNLAFINHLLGDYTQAAIGYCDAINLKPDNFDAHYNFALLLRSMNLNKEALQEFEKTTMLLDYYGNDEKTKYVFGIITEIKRRIMNEGGYDYLKDRVDITSLGKDDITYSNGKLVVSKQKEFKMKELLKCKYRKKFETH